MEERFNANKAAQKAQATQADAMTRIAAALERLADKYAPKPVEEEPADEEGTDAKTA